MSEEVVLPAQILDQIQHMRYDVHSFVKCSSIYSPTLMKMSLVALLWLWLTVAVVIIVDDDVVVVVVVVVVHL